MMLMDCLYKTRYPDKNIKSVLLEKQNREIM